MFFWFIFNTSANSWDIENILDSITIWAYTWTIIYNYDLSWSLISSDVNITSSLSTYKDQIIYNSWSYTNLIYKDNLWNYALNTDFSKWQDFIFYILIIPFLSIYFFIKIVRYFIDLFLK